MKHLYCRFIPLFACLFLVGSSCQHLWAGDESNIPENTDTLNLGQMIEPVDKEYFFRDDDYYNWCNSIIKDQTGTYHLFYSRWPREYTFKSWLTHSEIVHTTAPNAWGPYGRGKTIMKGRAGKWDEFSVFNVKTHRFGNQYYLYYTASNAGSKGAFSKQELLDVARKGYSHPHWMTIRNAQRTGVAVSDTLDGPWLLPDTPMVEPGGAIKSVTVNPAIAQREDGKFCLIIKGDSKKAGHRKAIQACCISDSPTSNFALSDKPAFDDIATEDASLWYDKQRKRFYAIFHAQGRNFLGLITSTDGLNWKKARHYEVCKKEIPLKDGSVIKVDNMERPFVLLENDIPVQLSVAVKKGNDTFIVFLPLKH